MWPQFYSTWYNYRAVVFLAPDILITDVTDHLADTDHTAEDYYALAETLLVKGPNACFEQAPSEGYNFLLATDRHYMLRWIDDNKR